MPESEDESNSL